MGRLIVYLFLIIFGSGYAQNIERFVDGELKDIFKQFENGRIVFKKTSDIYSQKYLMCYQNDHHFLVFSLDADDKNKANKITSISIYNEKIDLNCEKTKTLFEFINSVNNCSSYSCVNEHVTIGNVKLISAISSKYDPVMEEERPDLKSAVVVYDSQTDECGIYIEFNYDMSGSVLYKRLFNTCNLD